MLLAIAGEEQSDLSWRWASGGVEGSDLGLGF